MKVRILNRAVTQWPLLAVTEESGAWREVGLEPEIDFVPKTHEADERLLKANTDFIFGSHISPYHHRARGVPIVYLAQTVNYTLDSVVSSLDLKGLKELEGRRVASVSEFSPKRTSHPRGNIILYLEREGVDINQVSFYQPQNGDFAEAVLRGEADAAFVTPPREVVYRKKGLKVLMLPKLPMVIAITVTALRPQVEKNPQVALKILQALILGIHWFKTQREKTLEILEDQVVPRLKFSPDPEVTLRLYEATANQLEALPYPRVEAIQNAFRLAQMIYPEVGNMNPLSLWDLHYLRMLDDEGFIRNLYGDTSSF